MSRATTADVQSTSYIEWGSVIAGALIAIGITAILVPFGNAIDLSVPNNFYNG